MHTMRGPAICSPARPPAAQTRFECLPHVHTPAAAPSTHSPGPRWARGPHGSRRSKAARPPPPPPPHLHQAQLGGQHGALAAQPGSLRLVGRLQAGGAAAALQEAKNDVIQQHQGAARCTILSDLLVSPGKQAGRRAATTCAASRGETPPSHPLFGELVLLKGAAQQPRRLHQRLHRLLRRLHSAAPGLGLCRRAGGGGGRQPAQVLWQPGRVGGGVAGGCRHQAAAPQKLRFQQRGCRRQGRSPGALAGQRIGEQVGSRNAEGAAPGARKPRGRLVTII
jgi:hypothetical protein